MAVAAGAHVVRAGEAAAAGGARLRLRRAVDGDGALCGKKKKNKVATRVEVAGGIFFPGKGNGENSRESPRPLLDPLTFRPSLSQCESRQCANGSFLFAREASQKKAEGGRERGKRHPSTVIPRFLWH